MASTCVECDALDRADLFVGMHYLLKHFLRFVVVIVVTWNVPLPQKMNLPFEITFFFYRVNINCFLLRTKYKTPRLATLGIMEKLNVIALYHLNIGTKSISESCFRFETEKIFVVTFFCQDTTFPRGI